MQPLFTSQTRHLFPAASNEYREEIFISPQDASRYGINAGVYAVLRVKNIVPEMPDNEEAVRINIDSEDSLSQKSLKINSMFFQELGFSLGQEWELLLVNDSWPIQKLTLEPFPPHNFLKEELVQMDRSDFNGRCLFVAAGKAEKDFLLRIGNLNGFKVRESNPNPIDLTGPAVLSIEPSTHISISIPGSQGGMDLVIILDVSKSMMLKDAEDPNGQIVTRMEAANRAVEMILEWHSRRSAPGSRFGLVVFGKNARVAYPDDAEELSEIKPYLVNTLPREIPNFFKRVDFSGSNIIEAINIAAKLLDNTPQQNNERIFVLISDGAYWTGQKRVIGSDPTTEFVVRFYQEKKICIHTIVVGSENLIRKFEQNYYHDDMTRPEGQRVHIPNPARLDQIAQLTNGKFFTVPNIGSLREIFDEWSDISIHLS